MKTWHLILVLAGVSLFSSCGLTDNEKPIPGFLELKEPKVTKPDGNGLDTHKITDVWVFADGQIVGVFPLPAKVPLEVTGKEQEITLLAGIRNNGMIDSPVFYPFYKSILTKVTPQEGKTIQIPLDFQYARDFKMPLNEGFETGNVFSIDFDNKPETKIITTQDTYASGSKSGLAILESGSTFIEVASASRVINNENARGQSYIELDYKGEGEISVGIAKIRSGIITGEYVLFVPGKETWNKIYVDVTKVLSGTDYDEYRIILAFRKTGFSEQSKLYIDNVRHLHF